MTAAAISSSSAGTQRSTAAIALSSFPWWTLTLNVLASCLPAVYFGSLFCRLASIRTVNDPPDRQQEGTKRRARGHLQTQTNKSIFTIRDAHHPGHSSAKHGPAGAARQRSVKLAATHCSCRSPTTSSVTQASPHSHPSYSSGRSASVTHHLDGPPTICTRCGSKANAHVHSPDPLRKHFAERLLHLQRRILAAAQGRKKSSKFRVSQRIAWGGAAAQCRPRPWKARSGCGPAPSLRKHPNPHPPTTPTHNTLYTHSTRLPTPPCLSPAPDEVGEQREEVLEVGPEGLGAEGQHGAQRGHHQRRQRRVLLRVGGGDAICKGVGAQSRGRVGAERSTSGEGGQCLGCVPCVERMDSIRSPQWHPCCRHWLCAAGQACRPTPTTAGGAPTGTQRAAALPQTRPPSAHSPPPRSCPWPCPGPQTAPGCACTAAPGAPPRSRPAAWPPAPLWRCAAAWRGRPARPPPPGAAAAGRAGSGRRGPAGRGRGWDGQVGGVGVRGVERRGRAWFRGFALAPGHCILLPSPQHTHSLAESPRPPPLCLSPFPPSVPLFPGPKPATAQHAYRPLRPTLSAACASSSECRSPMSASTVAAWVARLRSTSSSVTAAAAGMRRAWLAYTSPHDCAGGQRAGQGVGGL